MNAFLTVMAAIGILVSLVVLAILVVVVRVILKVRRGLAQGGGLHFVDLRRSTGTDADFARMGSITLASSAWSSSGAPGADSGDTCQTDGGWSDGGSGDSGSSDCGGGSGGD